MVRVGIFLVIGAFAHGGLADEGVLEKERADVMRRKLEATVLPRAEFKKVEVAEALEYFSKLSREQDPWAVGDEKAGVSLMVLGDLTDADRVSMDLKSVPLIEALRYLAERSGTKFSIGAKGVVFEMAAKDELQMLEVSVPPLFEEFGLDWPRGDAIDPFAPAEPNPGIGRDRLHSARLALTEVGIDLKDGDSVYLHKGILTVRSSPKAIEQILFYVTDLQRARLSIRIRLDLYEMGNADASEIVERTLKKSAAGAEIAEAKALAEKGKARLLNVPSLVTGSGLRAKVKSGKAVVYISRYEAVKGKDVPVWEEESHGTSFEVDPIIGSDGVTVDINVALEMRTGEPKLVKETVEGPATGRELEVEIYSYDERWISTSVTTLSGQTQLIGSLSPSAEDGKTVLAFLTVGITRALPEKK